MEIMNQNLYERVEREKYSHIHNNVLTESYRLKDTFYHTRCYPTLQRLLEKRNSYFNNIKGKIILDIGCGWGDTSLSLLKRGAIIKGIDITPEYIERAKKIALDNGFLGDQFEFKVMDAHKLDFENKSFDIVIGEGILHHLELYSSLRIDPKSSNSKRQGIIY